MKQGSEPSAARGPRSHGGASGATPGLVLALAILPAALGGCVVPDPGEVAPTSERPVRQGRLVDGSGPVLLWGEWIGPGSDPVAAEYLVEAHRSARRGALDEAAAILEEACASLPEDPCLFKARGAVLAEMGFTRAAEHEFARAAELDPACAGVWWALGRARLELGMPVSAFDALQRSLGLGEDDPELSILLARVHRQRSEPDAAVRHYAASLERDLEAPAERLLEAASLLAEEESEAFSPWHVTLALGWLDRAEDLMPGSSRAHLVRALVLERHGEREAAQRSFARALELEDDPERRREISVLLASSH